MTLYHIKYKKSVDKDLRKIPKSYRIRIVTQISRLSTNPKPNKSVKLKGSTDLFRIRVGDYRIIYQINGSELVVLVIKVGHRKAVYKTA